MQINEDRQRQIKNYTRASRYFTSVFTFPSAIVGGVFIGLAGSNHAFENTTLWLYLHLPLLQWQPVEGWYPLQVLAYYLFFMIVFTFFSFLSLLYMQHLKRRYRIPRQSLRLLFAIFVRTRLFTIGWWALLVEALYFFFALQPATWWFWTALVHICMLVILACVGPFRGFSLFTVRPLPESEQANRIRAWLAQHSGHTYHLFEVDLPGGTMQANAWAVGWGGNRRIFFSSTLLKAFPAEEIEVIVAHELGHHLHHDTWQGLFYRSILWFASYFLFNVVALQWQDFRLYDFGTNTTVITDAMLQDPAVANLFNNGVVNSVTLLVLLIYLGAFSSCGTVFYNIYSRGREYRADEFALQTTRNAAVFKSAFIRLANINWTSIQPAGLNNTTHPFTASRLKHADDFAKAQMK
jgi:STE24 endopeptidase